MLVKSEQNGMVQTIQNFKIWASKKTKQNKTKQIKTKQNKNKNKKQKTNSNKNNKKMLNHF